MKANKEVLAKKNLENESGFITMYNFFIFKKIEHESLYLN